MNKSGVNIVKKAIEEPLKMIACNAGLEGSIVVEKSKGKEGRFLVSMPALTSTKI